jgi:hypothetical protein
VSLEARLADDSWRHAVTRLLQVADVTLLDVSRPGDGLCWELERALARAPEALVLVACAPDIEAWLNEQAHPTGSPAARIAELLRGRVVLCYPRHAWLLGRGFGRSLRRAILDRAPA